MEYFIHHILSLFVDLSKDIDRMSEDYVGRVRDMDGEARTEHLKKIESAFAKSKEYGDDKVQLAMQTYEMVSTDPAVCITYHKTYCFAMCRSDPTVSPSRF